MTIIEAIIASKVGCPRCGATYNAPCRYRGLRRLRRLFGGRPYFCTQRITLYSAFVLGDMR